MRELIILILGLAVIAIILRGLHLAMQTRKGQIRLAIDKNIPQDLDLEELELSELPSGGARVVRRSFDHVNRQNSAQDELDLGVTRPSNNPIPVLMDTVEVRDSRTASATARSATSTASEKPVKRNSPSSGEKPVSIRRTFQPSSASERTVPPHFAADTPSKELTSQVQEEISEEATDVATKGVAGAEGGEKTAPGEARTNVQDEMDDASDTDPNYDDTSRNYESDMRDEPRIQEPELQSESESEFDDEFSDDFSMSAGERIGGSSAETGEDSYARQAPSPRPKSLFRRLADKVLNAGARQQDEMQDDPELEFEPQDSDSEIVSRTSVRERDSTDSGGEKEKQAPAQRRTAITDINEAKETHQETNESVNQDRPIEAAEVLVINVMSKEGELFYGPDLLQVFITAGLKFGEMDIFHKHADSSNSGPVIFSVANIMNPGTFEIKNMENFSTRGVSLFFAMPAVVPNPEAFDQMLKVAQQIRGALDGELKDDHRNVMTAQTIEHYRQRIQEFELRKIKAAQARS